MEAPNSQLRLSTFNLQPPTSNLTTPTEVASSLLFRAVSLSKPKQVSLQSFSNSLLSYTTTLSSLSTSTISLSTRSHHFFFTSPLIAVHRLTFVTLSRFQNAAYPFLVSCIQSLNLVSSLLFSVSAWPPFLAFPTSPACLPYLFLPSRPAPPRCF